MAWDGTRAHEMIKTETLRLALESLSGNKEKSTFPQLDMLNPSAEMHSAEGFFKPL